ncbi:FSR family fosmidomycin resistance protein-like MFS transporter [Constrictibacter sp. MBR-5]|jgi:FSR family fosmidomycin resistance protein-like MFS transporter|uniref:MFS transporter n=1 Tax=Constrictibacter sp. MBR-5 TaxID=3156467 RepID=UPI003393D780
MTISAPALSTRQAALPVLVALSVTHLLNDMIQSLIPAIYPIIKDAYGLDFVQIGLITLTFQISASLLQPVVGMYTDKHPMPYSMVVGMGFTLAGLLGLAHAGSYGFLLVSAACVGIGSSIFHPEATRMARNASGGRHGFAQGIFQVGGQAGGALGPLLAAFIIVPRGQESLGWFSGAALVAMVLMVWTAGRYAPFAPRRLAKGQVGHAAEAPAPITAGAVGAIVVLIILLFSKSAYSSSFTSFYTFYLMGKFDVSVQFSQVMLFLFLVSSAAGALGGGMLGDRIGRNRIIWFSILGALPFTLALPYADLFWTGVLTVIINLIMSSAFAAILIYAIELLPGRIGLVGGFFYGLSFGLGGIAAAILGQAADQYGIETVYRICSFLPAIGLLAYFLPRLRSA